MSASLKGRVCLHSLTFRVAIFLNRGRTMSAEKTEKPKRRHRLTKAEEEELILRIGELGGKGLGLGSIRIQLRLTEKQFLRLYARGLELGLFEPFSSDDVILAKHLPLSLRKALGLNSEDSVQVISKNDEIILKKFIIN